MMRRVFGKRVLVFISDQLLSFRDLAKHVVKTRHDDHAEDGAE